MYVQLQNEKNLIHGVLNTLYSNKSLVWRIHGRDAVFIKSKSTGLERWLSS